jgi:hypothetical protein
VTAQEIYVVQHEWNEPLAAKIQKYGGYYPPYSIDFLILHVGSLSF